MKYLAMLLVLALAKADEKCSDIKINGKYFEREKLKSDLDKPYMMTTDYTTNTLYFSYTADESESKSKNISFCTMKYNLNTKIGKLIEVVDGFSTTVDSKTKDIYIGGDGICKFDPATEKCEQTNVANDIWSVYSQDGVLYYITYPSQFLFSNKGGNSQRYKDLEDIKLDNFAIDKEDTMVYSNISGLYGQKMGTKDAVTYKQYTDEDFGVRGISVDPKGEVYVCDDAGISKINKNTKSLESVIEVDDCYGIAFDANNQIIYSDANTVYRLVPKNC